MNLVDNVIKSCEAQKVSQKVWSRTYKYYQIDDDRNASSKFFKAILYVQMACKNKRYKINETKILC